ncbi:MAG: peptidoglycan editing factor PgeF [Thiohalocapsa sp.]|uniref:peptidoglycan editing factor PgeF n=1 Tax=Thiohalocapsa sp. TaxID=2497641 RepID=UPI0025DB4400|nr:peptidoglycan editing factor PgeF [Thiohalocapsa sp.]MCG6940798.1 peptidoglycan editing factor PgeF [Thiohalocapsa sp.]
MTTDELILPDWPAPANVRACTSTRRGGVSGGPFASLNLAAHVGDDAAAVAANRRRLRAVLDLPAEPLWLSQVHGCEAVSADRGPAAARGEPPVADAAVSRAPGRVCAVLTADCLPLLLCDRAGTTCAAVHAGWRGLHRGVIEATLARLGVPGSELLAWLGPAIGPARFEVGPEVRAAFLQQDAAAASAFRAGAGDRWLADLYALARLRLSAAGVSAVSGGDLCTLSDRERFFSYRRDGRTGRMATLIWLTRSAG